jgi:hypothetical protein
MHRGVSSITSRLDNIKPNDDGETFTLTLSREDVDAFQELKAKRVWTDSTVFPSSGSKWQ